MGKSNQNKARIAIIGIITVVFVAVAAWLLGKWSAPTILKVFLFAVAAWTLGQWSVPAFFKAFFL